MINPPLPLIHAFLAGAFAALLLTYLTGDC
jgi:hypothetical protein